MQIRLIKEINDKYPHEIRMIEYKKKGKFGTGFAIGMGISMAVGGIFGVDVRQKTRMLNQPYAPEYMRDMILKLTKQPFALLKSEILHDMEKLERLFEKFSLSYNRYQKKRNMPSIIGIENIRPAVISETNYKYLDELRAFRHFFRHTYDFDLEDEKFAIVASKTRELKKNYQKDIENIIHFIDDLLKEEP